MTFVVFINYVILTMRLTIFMKHYLCSDLIPFQIILLFMKLYIFTNEVIIDDISLIFVMISNVNIILLWI